MPYRIARLRDALDGASAHHRARLLLQNVGILRPARGLVLGLDQQPRLLPLARPFAHAHQMPAALELVTVEGEVETSLGKAPVRVALRKPLPAVPDQHRAAAILAFRDRAFEIVVFDRVILDVHGEAFFARHQARPARHRPALHHAVEFEPQIVMQPCRRVLLDHEGIAAALDLAAARLRGDAELALLAIFLERRTLLAHDPNPKTGSTFSGSFGYSAFFMRLCLAAFFVP